MDISLKCSLCDKLYNCNRDSIKVVGPVVETHCPHCRTNTIQGFNLFLKDQTDYMNDSIKKAACMIKLGRLIESKVNKEHVSARKYINRYYPTNAGDSIYEHSVKELVKCD